MMELCTMVYNSKSGAQCAMWCMNSLFFLIPWCTNASEEVQADIDRRTADLMVGVLKETNFTKKETYLVRIKLIINLK